MENGTCHHQQQSQSVSRLARGDAGSPNICGQNWRLPGRRGSAISSTSVFSGERHDAAYNAIVIGDPSAAACSSTVPTDALSTAGTWGAAVNGNVAVLGTAPALAGATTLISDAIAYAASGAKAGLYVSLNCEYATA